MLCAGCTPAPVAPPPVIVYSACPKVSYCPMPGTRIKTHLFMQLLAWLDIRETGSVRHGLPHKRLIRPSASESDLNQRPFGRKLEHPRIITRHRNR